MLLPLFAVEINDGWFVGGIGTVIAAVVTALGAALAKYMKQDQAGKATTFSEMQKIVRQLTQRVSELEAHVSECHDEKAAIVATNSELLERVRWLELNPGKSPHGSGVHRPVTGTEGADL